MFGLGAFGEIAFADSGTAPGGNVINLIGAPCVQANSCSTGSVSVTNGPKTINLVGAPCSQANSCSVGTVTVGVGGSLLALVSFSRIVIFEGSGPRLELGEMTAKPAYKVGDKWMNDRDPDEKSRYAQDITDELTDRKTTALDGEVELVLVGVEALEPPALETALIDGELRTFVIAFLGPVEGAIPDGWSWAARVNCANGERFDATTYFNRKDT